MVMQINELKISMAHIVKSILKRSRKVPPRVIKIPKAVAMTRDAPVKIEMKSITRKTLQYDSTEVNPKVLTNNTRSELLY